MNFSIDFWIVVMGILCNVSCALLGCYLVLRRMSLLGDAISHAILPGLVLAFVFFESRASLPLFLGAMALGVFTAFMTQTIHQFARVSEDTSMGVVFTSLFALGLVLIKVVPGLDKVHFDAACVFEGNIEYEALYLVPLPGGLEVPRAAILLGLILLANLIFMTVLWKELKLATFDPLLSSSLGFSSGFLFYAIMAMVAGTTVGAFWAVGSILVIAMLIVPGATAQLLTDRFGFMLLIAAAVGVVSAIGGYFFADHFDTNTAGMMAVVAGAQYALALFLSPVHGVLTRWVRHLAMAFRISREDLLAAMYRLEERNAPESAVLARAEVDTVAGGRWSGLLGLWFLERRGQLCQENDGVRLTDRGRSVAAALVRSHRLWESYLAEHVALPADHLHAPAMRMEHYVTPEIEAELKRGIKDVKNDPHGRPIPGIDTDESK